MHSVHSAARRSLHCVCCRWTLTTDPHEYSRFLKKLFRAVASGEPPPPTGALRQGILAAGAAARLAAAQHVAPPRATLAGCHFDPHGDAAASSTSAIAAARRRSIVGSEQGGSGALTWKSTSEVAPLHQEGEANLSGLRWQRLPDGAPPPSGTQLFHEPLAAALRREHDDAAPVVELSGAEWEGIGLAEELAAEHFTKVVVPASSADRRGAAGAAGGRSPGGKKHGGAVRRAAAKAVWYRPVASDASGDAEGSASAPSPEERVRRQTGHKQRRAAVSIQSLARCHLGFKSHREKKDAALKIAAIARGRRERAAFLAARESAITIQKDCRRRLARTKLTGGGVAGGRIDVSDVSSRYREPRPRPPSSLWARRQLETQRQQAAKATSAQQPQQLEQQQQHTQQQQQQQHAQQQHAQQQHAHAQPQHSPPPPPPPPPPLPQQQWQAPLPSSSSLPVLPPRIAKLSQQQQQQQQAEARRAHEHELLASRAALRDELSRVQHRIVPSGGGGAGSAAMAVAYGRREQLRSHDYPQPRASLLQPQPRVLRKSASLPATEPPPPNTLPNSRRPLPPLGMAPRESPTHGTQPAHHAPVHVHHRRRNASSLPPLGFADGSSPRDAPPANPRRAREYFAQRVDASGGVESAFGAFMQYRGGE